MMVGQRRQAWCPRCDEVRRARPGSPCPVCSASMVALPQLSKAPSWRGGRAVLLQRLGSLLPAARVVAATAVALALVVAAFAAGRSSRPTAEAAAAAPTTATRPAGRPLPGGGLSTDVSRVLGWSVMHGAVTLTLNRITATAGTTRITFQVSGLEREWALASVIGLQLEDSSGRQLAIGRPSEPLAVDGLENLSGGGVLGTVKLSRRIDPNAVAGATVSRVIAMRSSGEHLRGTLVDEELKRLVDASPQNMLNRQGPCPACSLEVRCLDCESVRVEGFTYRDGRVVVLLSQEGGPSPGQESLADADISVATGAGGQVGSFESTALSGDTVVEFAGRDLAASTERGQRRMSFDVVATVTRSQSVSGPWRLDQRGGQR
jgi:hypothetical protein